jgi:hypothetical protein
MDAIGASCFILLFSDFVVWLFLLLLFLLLFLLLVVCSVEDARGDVVGGGV